MQTTNYSLVELFDSMRFGNTRDSVLFVQKGVADYVFKKLGQGRFGRKGYFELGGNILLQVKTPQDIEMGGKITDWKEQFIITGTDVMRKGEVSGVFTDRILQEISSEEVWGSRSTLSVFGPRESLQRMTQDIPPDIIYTRGTPTLTQSALDFAYKYEDIEIREVDGNTEAYVAIEAQKNPKLIICGTEFVQTGRSLQETGSLLLRSDGIYEPQRGSDGEFIFLEQNQSPQAKSFAEKLTIEVNIILAQILPRI